MNNLGAILGLSWASLEPLSAILGHIEAVLVLFGSVLNHLGPYIQKNTFRAIRFAILENERKKTRYVLQFAPKIALTRAFWNAKWRGARVLERRGGFRALRSRVLGGGRRNGPGGVELSCF